MTHIVNGQGGNPVVHLHSWVKYQRRRRMALESHIRELDSRHRDLDLTIRARSKSPSVDDLELSILKKQKLRIKEQIDALKQR
jgi:hypothetical protein